MNANETSWVEIKRGPFTMKRQSTAEVVHIYKDPDPYWEDDTDPKQVMSMDTSDLKYLKECLDWIFSSDD